MPNVTIYVPDELREQLRAHDINVSRVCQAALARKVRQRERRSTFHEHQQPCGCAGCRVADGAASEAS